jgi:hypothetical protein
LLHVQFAMFVLLDEYTDGRSIAANWGLAILGGKMLLTAVLCAYTAAMGQWICAMCAFWVLVAAPAHGESDVAITVTPETDEVTIVGEPGIDEAHLPEDERAAAMSRQRRLLREQAQRLAWRLAEEVRFSIEVAERERDIVDRKLDAVLPLDAPQRGDDLRQLVAWYDDYLRRLNDLGTEVEREYGRLAAGGEVRRELLKSCGQQLVQEHRELSKALQASVQLFRREEARLRQLIARRQTIDHRHAQLVDQLQGVENRLRDPQRAASRQDDLREASQLRDLISAVRQEMLVTPVVREDALAHYEGIIIQAEAEQEWLAMKQREFSSLEALLDLPEGEGRKFMARLERRFRQLILVLENEVADLNRKIDLLDAQRAAVVPFGTLRELDKARELWNSYIEQKRKFEDQIKRSKQQIGALEAELSQLQTLLRR